MQRLKQFVWPLLLICSVLAAYSHFRSPAASTRPEGPPGWEELILCSELTSIDSKKSLSLKSDLNAELIERGDSDGPKTSKGHWSLLDAEKHLYQIDIADAVSNYIVVSPPDAEGCILAQGGLNYADLRHSWFSIRIDPADYEDPR